MNYCLNTNIPEIANLIKAIGYNTASQIIEYNGIEILDIVKSQPFVDLKNELSKSYEYQLNNKKFNGSIDDMTEISFWRLFTPSFYEWFGDWMIQYKLQNGLSLSEKEQEILSTKYTGSYDNLKADISKLVTEDGLPKLVYHGSNRDFINFDTKWYGHAHFGTFEAAYDRLVRFKYGEEKDGYIVNGTIKSYFLNIKKEIKINDAGSKWYEIKTNNDEGLVYINKSEDIGSISYAVNNPNQIKSAILPSEDMSVLLVENLVEKLKVTPEQAKQLILPKFLSPTNNEIIYFQRLNEGTYGFVTSDGKVFIDKSTQSLNTPFHEFYHIYDKIIMSNYYTDDRAKSIIDRLNQLVIEGGYLDKVKGLSRYAKDTYENQMIEARAMLIGDAADSKIREAEKGFLNKLKVVLKDLVDYILDLIGTKSFKDYTPEQILNMTMEEFTNIMTHDMLFDRSFDNNYIGNFSEIGKGTFDGDGKDKAMRNIAVGFIGELNPNKSDRFESSTYGSFKHFNNSNIIEEDRYIHNIPNDTSNGNKIMLALNGSINDTDILQKTKSKILELHNQGFEFIVGDMSSSERRLGDDIFVNYLKSINAKFIVYGNGKESRLSSNNITIVKNPNNSYNIFSNNEKIGVFMVGPDIQYPDKQSIGFITLNKDYRGKGFSEEIYDKIADLTDYNLISDIELSEAGDRVWQSLLRKGKATIIGKIPNGRNRYAYISNKNIELTPEQRQNIKELKNLEPAYAKANDEVVQEFIESLIPNSQVKDIVWHGSDTQLDLNTEPKKRNFDFSKGFHFDYLYDKAYRWGKNVIPVIVDVRTPHEIKKTDDIEYARDRYMQSSYLSALAINDYDPNVHADKVYRDGIIKRHDTETGGEYLNIASKKQITVLNSPETIAKWNEFLDKRKYNVQSQDLSTIKPGVSELFESNPELANSVYEALGFNNLIKSTDKIVWGHPAIGKTTMLESNFNAFIDWDNEFNRKRDNWIASKSNTSIGTPEFKKARNEYMINYNNHKNYVAFVTEEWRKAKEKASKENKILIASPHMLLNLFPNDFDKVITMSDKTFMDRAIKRSDGDKVNSRLWKKGINETLKSIDKSKIIKTDKYINDLFITPQQKQQALQLYSQYLDTIFPDSKIKEIVYHSSPNKIETFRETMFGTYFAYSPIKGAYGSVINSVLLNVENPLIKPKPDDSREAKETYNKEYRNYNNPTSFSPEGIGTYKYDASIETSSVTKEGVQIKVRKPEQIHILGSKEDMENFANFVKNSNIGDVRAMQNYMDSKSVEYIMEKLIQYGKIEKKC